MGGGLLLLLGVILAVLTVELAADPDKWPGRSEAMLAAAQRMFRVSSAAGLAAADGGASSSGVGAGGGGLQEPLLQADEAGGDQEIQQAA